MIKQFTPKDAEPPYFDEAFNGVTNQKQLGVHHIYFDEYLQKTQTVF